MDNRSFERADKDAVTLNAVDFVFAVLIAATVVAGFVTLVSFADGPPSCVPKLENTWCHYGNMPFEEHEGLRLD
jgi:hypothetical protein